MERPNPPTAVWQLADALGLNIKAFMQPVIVMAMSQANAILSDSDAIAAYISMLVGKAPPKSAPLAMFHWFSQYLATDGFAWSRKEMLQLVATVHCIHLSSTADGLLYVPETTRHTMILNQSVQDGYLVIYSVAHSAVSDKAPPVSREQRFCEIVSAVVAPAQAVFGARQQINVVIHPLMATTADASQFGPYSTSCHYHVTDLPSYAM